MWQQFDALVRKELILKARTWKTTVLSILLPAVVFVLLVIARESVSKKSVAERHYLEENRTLNSTDIWWQLERTWFAPLDEHLAFVPDSSPLVHELADDFGTAFPFLRSRLWFFESGKALEEYTASRVYGKGKAHASVWAGVELLQTGGQSGLEWRYILRMNASDPTEDVDPPQALPDMRFLQEVDTLNRAYQELDWTRYFTLGFLSLQQFVDHWIIQRCAGVQPDIAFTALPFPTVDHIDDDFPDLVGTFFGLLFTMAFIWPVCTIVRQLVVERETKLKALLRSMGMQFLPHEAAFLLTNTVVFALIAALLTATTSTTVFQYSDKGLIFLMLFSFGMSLYGFCVFFASLFGSARLASTLAGVFYLLSFFPYFSVAGPEVDESKKTAACFSPAACLSLAAQLAARLEAEGSGVDTGTYDKLFTNFRFSTAVGMFWLDFFLFYIVGLYLTLVWTHGSDVPLPWNFLFTKRFWRCGRKPGREEESKSPVDEEKRNEVEVEMQSRAAVPGEKEGSVEAVPQSVAVKLGVRLRGLRKEYPTEDGLVVAVEGLDLDMYEGQVSVVLGHNGAGKTTAISMITGQTKRTAGNIEVFGTSVDQNLDYVRSLLGVVPQADVLFELLTVREHLTLCARLKRMPAEEVATEVDAMIQKLALERIQHSQARTLSGGQKRQLHVGMAMLGNSKIVVLDEPTSGMDPFARRRTWELIRASKDGRVILLTTHHMNEADELGDRIAILNRGRLCSCGSSLFLKAKYGVGYTMTCLRSLHTSVPSSVLKETVAQFVNRNNVSENQMTVLSESGAQIKFRLPFEASSSFQPLFNRFDADPKALGLESYGISVTTLQEVFLRVGEEADLNEARRAQLQSKRNLALEKEEKETQFDVFKARALEKKDMEEDERETRRLQSISFCRQLRALLVKRWRNVKRDRIALLWQFVYPLLILAVGLFIVKIAVEFKFPTELMTTAAFGDSPLPYNAPQGHELFARLPDTPDSNCEALGVNHTSTLANMSQYLLDSFAVQSFDKRRYGAFVMDQSTPTEVAVFLNTSAVHALPVFFNLLSNLLFQHLNGSEASILTYSTPFPETHNQKAVWMSYTCVVVSIAFAFIPASFIGLVVFERKIKAKHQQFLSGLSPIAYWVSNFIWDFATFLVLGFACVGLFAAYNLEELIGANISVSILVIVLYGLAICPFVYLLSFAFHKPAKAQNTMLLLNMFFGVVVLFISIVMDVVVEEQSTRDKNNILRYFYRLSPAYAFSHGIGYLIVRQSTLAMSTVHSRWHMNVAGWDMVFMAIECVVFFAATLWLECGGQRWLQAQWTQKHLCWRRRPTSEVCDPEEGKRDVDVLLEEQRVMQGEASEDIIVLKRLRKVYPGAEEAAVKSLCFAVPQGECFGFLGFNGAGKTTTLKMLTGDLEPTEGGATLCGFDLQTESASFRRRIGYCPQSDATFPNLTAREELTFYARLKGLEEDEVPATVARIIEQLGISEYADRASRGYSGGTRRKLSIAVALLGDPSVLLLDEPTTGMDPKSRRFIWDLLSSTMLSRSVILTTHSLEEAEVLCGRIAIMARGRLQCLGSAQHLKAKFGKGWQIEVTSNKDKVDEACAFVEKQFPEVTLIEQTNTSAKFHLPRGNRTLGDTFGVLEAHCTTLGLGQYSVSETTLEQIFLRLGRKELEEEEEKED